jgi:predicted enzyme related to lactoylglutathione lyase
MLTKSPITTMLPVADMDRAARFYGQTLGLEERTATPDGGRIFSAGSDAIGLLPAEAGAQSQHTVLSFEGPDIAAEVRELTGRGVEFADYDLPDLKTVDHVAELGSEKAAWFTDTEGNILCIHQPT